MKLRNRENNLTGKLTHIDFDIDDSEKEIDLTILLDNGDGESIDRQFYSLAELKSFLRDWEEYEPAEPLIEDTKARKVFREWADLIGAKRFRVEHLCKYGRTIIMSTDIIAKPVIELPGYIGEDFKTYTKIELVGEEIE